MVTFHYLDPEQDFTSRIVESKQDLHWQHEPSSLADLFSFLQVVSVAQGATVTTTELVWRPITTTYVKTKYGYHTFYTSCPAYY